MKFLAESALRFLCQFCEAMHHMKIDIMTLFPEAVGGMLHSSILGRAEQKGILDINCIQIRDFTENKQMQVDDYPLRRRLGLCDDGAAA